MPQACARVVLHLVFSTKGRAPYLQNAEVRANLYKYMAGILKEIGCPAILINGVADHVHVLCNLSRTISIADLHKELKGSSSKWMKDQGPEYQGFSWQAGYGAFSVSQSKVEQVRLYVANQEEHHRRITFQEELRALCMRHGIQLDERYAWD